MTIHTVTLHTVSAGLVTASIAGVMGYIPIIIASLAGIAAIVSYTFAVLDSPTFQHLHAKIKSKPPEKSAVELASPVVPTDTR